MIFTALTNQRAFRVMKPKYSYAPISGSGAGQYGGRANRPGLKALYLSLDINTALAEYAQLSPLMPPGTIVSYNVNAAKIVDFREGMGPQWDWMWQDFYCDWREIYFNQKIEPPSWLAGDETLAAGAVGILFRSVLPGITGDNLVLYTEYIKGNDSIVALDPSGDLPRNLDSWSVSL